MGGEGGSFRRRAARTWFGQQLARRAPLGEIAFDRGEGDPKGAHDLRAGHAPIDRFHDSLTQIF